MTKKTISLGIQANTSTTEFEQLICPYCHDIIAWKDFISVVDAYDTLSTDGSVKKENYVCPICNQTMIVFLNVLCHAEKII